MITLHLIRHGETVHNHESRIQGHDDSPLTDLGRRQVEAVANRLASERVSTVYSSDLGRAVVTAEAIASRHGLTVIETDLLREAYHGDVQGMTAAEFEQTFPEQYRLWRQDSGRYRPPGAETMESVIERCGEFLDQTARKHAEGEVIVAAVHGGSLRGLICAALGLSVTLYRGIHSANASLSTLQIGDRNSLWLLNDTCHLRNVTVTEEDADNVPH